MLSKLNLKKPDNKLWKKIADIALYTLPLYNGVVLGMPLSDNTKLWIVTGLNTIVVLFKAISKFTTENEEVITDTNDSSASV